MLKSPFSCVNYYLLNFFTYSFGEAKSHNPSCVAPLRRDTFHSHRSRMGPVCSSGRTISSFLKKQNRKRQSCDFKLIRISPFQQAASSKQYRVCIYNFSLPSFNHRHLVTSINNLLDRVEQLLQHVLVEIDSSVASLDVALEVRQFHRLVLLPHVPVVLVSVEHDDGVGECEGRVQVHERMVIALLNTASLDPNDKNLIRFIRQGSASEADSLSDPCDFLFPPTDQYPENASMSRWMTGASPGNRKVSKYIRKLSSTRNPSNLNVLSTN